MCLEFSQRFSFSFSFLPFQEEMRQNRQLEIVFFAPFCGGSWGAGVEIDR